MALKFLGKDSGRLPRIDRYELIAEIASGGMASVYLARLVGVGGFERFFAIKRLHPHLCNEEGFVSMFLDEARIVAGIRHQHVVPVLEVGASEHGYYLVMEYVEGETLGAFISRSIDGDEPMPPDVAIRILIDTLGGLHAAHEHVDPDGNLIGLVHRDVSPQNILVDVNGVARIADFGVAHATSRLSSTRAGQLKGKVAYMAPEQARGQTVTPRSDVFAAGIVLWEALCQSRLFLADNEAVTLNRLIFEPIPRIREVNPELPSAVEKVLARALERDPANRYATAADMADDLQVAARASRLLGAPSDVRTYVGNVIGVAMERRRASVRNHLAQMTSSQGPGGESSSALDRPDIGAVKPSDSSVSSAAMAVPTPLSYPSSPRELTSPAVPYPSRSSSKLAMFIVAGGLVGALVVAGGWLALGEPASSVGPAAGSSSQQQPMTPPDAAARPSSEIADASADVVPSASAAVEPPPEEPPVPTPPVDTTPKRSIPSKPPPGPTPTATVPSATSTAPTGTPRPATPGTTAPAADDDLKRNPYR
jgi:eukaryotic-like serine/threonine-protein kinase